MYVGETELFTSFWFYTRHDGYSLVTPCYAQNSRK